MSMRLKKQKQDKKAGHCYYLVKEEDGPLPLVYKCVSVLWNYCKARHAAWPLSILTAAAHFGTKFVSIVSSSSTRVSFHLLNLD